MGISVSQWSGVVSITMCIFLLSNSCYSTHAPYKHLSLDNDEILVDKIVSLETDNAGNDHKIVKIVTTEIDHDKPQETMVTELERSNLELRVLIQELQDEVRALKSSQYADRKTISELDMKVEMYHDEAIISTAEVVQIRQLVSENFDKTSLLEEINEDHSVLLEGLKIFEKEAARDLRRFKEYKEEKAAKRFHQLTKQTERCQKESENLKIELSNLTQEFISLQNQSIILQGKYQSLQTDNDQLRNVTIILQSDLEGSMETITSCCNTQNKMTNQNMQYTVTNQKTEFSANRNKLPSKLMHEIEIVEFGSGEFRDEILSKLEEETNQVETGTLNSEYGSGETIYEGSGEIGSGQAELPPFINVHNYVHIDTFRKEKAKWESNFLQLSNQYFNVTNQISEIESKVTSIKLGNFMQNLQESLINFTQNVITLDQWKVSSNSIVNSTLSNQDHIIKLSNMVVENSDKIADLKWKASNDNLLSDQQFNILRMYIIRLNNSMEDIKEQIKGFEKNSNNKYRSAPGYQATYYDYQTRYRPQTGDQSGEQTTQNTFEDQSKDSFEVLMSRIDDMGLQIVFNQNRLGNLEVKFLNESLYSCRKFNMDAYQDSQLNSHETIIKSNTKSLMLIHELVKELDHKVNSLNSEVKSNVRRIRTVNGNTDSLRGLIPALIGLKKEVDNLLYQLPTDCSEYYKRGFRTSGVYVIHPPGASTSSQVTCHMTKDEGWTVIQQRFDGSVDFRRNWTDYVRGFGKVDTEYWIGNNQIHLLTAKRNNSLQISMIDIYDNYWSASYENFSVSSPADFYTLHVSGYSGNVTDAMTYSSSMAFSTRDKDNDASSTNCGFYYESGWWFKHCQMCNLNGKYNIGLTWFNQDTKDWLRLKSSVMMIIPR